MVYVFAIYNFSLRRRNCLLAGTYPQLCSRTYFSLSLSLSLSPSLPPSLPLSLSSYILIPYIDECDTWRTRSGKCCVWPFIYQGHLYYHCSRYSSFYWCPLTTNYNSDGEWDYCEGKKYALTAFTTLKPHTLLP